MSLSGSVLRQNKELHATVRGQQEKLNQLSEVGFVASHLRIHGVGPYLTTAAERVTKDLQDVSSILGCTHEQAVQHVLRTTVGPEPASYARDS